MPQKMQHIAKTDENEGRVESWENTAAQTTNQCDSGSGRL